MFTRLLVPLDGSPLAESVLPIARYFAARLHATIILFHAIEEGAPATVHGQRHLSGVQEAQSYLDEIAERLRHGGGAPVAVEANVHPVEQTRVALSILEHVNELNADLIILCAHGRGGLRDVLVGSIAQQVIQRGTTPVLFIRPDDGADAGFQLKKLLLPLDGTPNHEPALPIAAELAREFDAALHLLTVVPTSGTLSAERAATGMLLPTTMNAVLELSERGAVEYLENISAGLLAQAIPTQATVARGDPPTAILAAVDREQADLTVLATHGHGSLDAFWSGSVTPKVLDRTRVPVLLVRVLGEESAR